MFVSPIFLSWTPHTPITTAQLSQPALVMPQVTPTRFRAMPSAHPSSEGNTKGSPASPASQLLQHSRATTAHRHHIPSVVFFKQKLCLSHQNSCKGVNEGENASSRLNRRSSYSGWELNSKSSQRHGGHRMFLSLSGLESTGQMKS